MESHRLESGEPRAGAIGTVVEAQHISLGLKLAGGSGTGDLK